MSDSFQPPPARSRRKLLAAGVGVAGALLGAGAALWRYRPSESSRLDPAFWNLSFDAPAGGHVSFDSFRGRPLLVNFWATWCPPCVEEMPLIDGFFRQNSAKSWQVVGLAIDQPSSVRKFLERTPVSYPVGLAGLGGTELAKSLGNDTGGLPFTIVMNSSGEVVQRRMGRLSATDLAQWATQV